MAVSAQQLYNLLLNNSAEVPTLRTRAISGNKQILNIFGNVIIKDMIKRSDHCDVAYKEINQLLVSARPQIVKYVDQNVISDVVHMYRENNNSQNGGLDYYIVLWKKMIGLNNTNYPSLSSKLKSIQLSQSKNTELPQTFLNHYRKFTKNQSQIFDQRVQFFPDSKTSFGNSSSNQNNSDHVIQQLAEGEYGTVQASSQQIQVDMKDIQELKGQIQSGNADLNNIGNYVRKVKQFLRMKPKSLRKQLSLDYNNDRIWAKEFLDNVKSDSYKNSLQLNRNTLQPSIRNSNLLSVQRAMLKQKPYESIKTPYQNNINPMQTFSSMKKSNPNQFSPPNRNNTSAMYNPSNTYNNTRPLPSPPSPASPSFATFPLSPSRAFPGQTSPFTTSFVQPQQNNQNNLMSSSVEVVTPHYNNINNNNNNNVGTQQIRNPVNGESVSFKKQYNSSGKQFEMQAYQSQTIPYNYSQFQKRNQSIGQDNNMFILPSSSQTNVKNSNYNQRMLINSKSADNLYSPASQRSRPRPRIFGHNTTKLSQPNEQNLQIINHGRNNPITTYNSPATAYRQDPNTNRHSGYQNMLNNQPVMQIGNFSSHQATVNQQQYYQQPQTVNYSNQLNGIPNAQSAIFSNNQVYNPPGYDFRSEKEIDTNNNNNNNGIVAVPYNPASGRYTFVSDQTPTAFSSQHQNSPIYRAQVYTPRTQAQIQQNWSNPNPNNNPYSMQLNPNIMNINSMNINTNRSPTTTNNNNNGLLKLSQFTNQKTKRKMQVAKNQLSSLENYIVKPYARNFSDMANFNRWRSTCLNDSFVLYSTPQLVVNGQIIRLSGSKIRMCLTYENKTNPYTPLELQTLYRIPKCMQVHKNSKISKNWKLSTNVNPTKHNFDLQLNSFPLQPCFLNLRYPSDSINNNYHNNYNNINNDNNNSNGVILTLPITIKNYIGYLITNQYQWINNWQTWTQANNFHRHRHIILQKQVFLNNDKPELTLKQFITLPPVSNYSVQQHGALCQYTQNILYLIRVSHRVDSIVSIQILANVQKLSRDQEEFLQYVLGVWAMLLAKIDKNQLG